MLYLNWIWTQICTEDNLPEFKYKNTKMYIHFESPNVKYQMQK